MASNNANPKTDAFIADRALGALVGAVIGDALGATLEFTLPDPLRFHSEMLGGGPLRLHPGEWTDDTAMALALSDTLIREDAFDPADFMSRLADWMRYGDFSCQGYCADIGRSTLAAVQRFIETGEALCRHEHVDGAGNGSLVRLAPVALRHLHDPEEAERVSRLQSICTHSARAASDACGFVTTMSRELILGMPDATAPRQLHPGAHPEIAAIAAGSYFSLRRLNPTGYVADTLETAMWALHHTEDFEQALIVATSLGGDADSIGAVTGMLAGATYGMTTMPDRWLRPLAWRDRILDIGRRLLQLAHD